MAWAGSAMPRFTQPHSSSLLRWTFRIIAVSLAICAFVCSDSALAGGPKYVAGVSYFNPGVLGKPIVWAGGRVSYFVDQGPLGPLTNAQATAMVDAAAGVWNGVSTAAVSLADEGSLAEDVNGSNVLGGTGQTDSTVFAGPSDVAPSASSTPVAVVFDSDGAVIDALDGADSSDPGNCSQNGVLVWIDRFNPDATLGHGVIVINGRCAASPSLLAMMSYMLERAFGSILGLDLSQVNDAALTNASVEPNGNYGWPVMDAMGGDCGPAGGTCIPSPASLRLDDIAALNRMYPVTSSNLSVLPGKVLTAANTVSIQGTITFRDQTGMQGVNVVARPIDSSGNPMYEYTVTSVSGAYFCGNHGNPVTGWVDVAGNQLDRFGSNDSALQGFVDLSGIPLPPGLTTANYQISFEPVNSRYFGPDAVGPYWLGSPSPSGSLATIELNGLTAGSTRTLNSTPGELSGPTATPIPDPITRPIRGPIFKPVTNPITSPVKFPIDDSSHDRNTNLQRAVSSPNPLRRSKLDLQRYSHSEGTQPQPTPMPPAGMWSSQLGQVGATDWFVFPVRGNRIFTALAQALDETGAPSASKAMPTIGVWDGFDVTGTTAVVYGSPQNGSATGETQLQVSTTGDDVVRLAITDARGDGRPDYAYKGWLLYADTVAPTRLPATGGTIVIHGMGFRPGDTVIVGGVAATVTEIMPTEITAVVPPNTSGATGSLDLQISEQPTFNAITVIEGGISYDASSSDSLSLVVAPSNLVPMDAPLPFTVAAEGSDGAPAGGVTITYAVTSGTATLGCGQAVCEVTATGDGRATISVTPTSSSIAVVTASLSNGASVQAHFYGGTPASLTALTPTLYLAAGATVQWPVQALVLNGNVPASGQPVSWQSATGITAPPNPISTDVTGVANAILSVSGLNEGESTSSSACLNGNVTCVAFEVFGARPEFATLEAISGTDQAVPIGSGVDPIILRVLDMNGHPMAGGTVSVSQALYAWTPPCNDQGRCPQAQLLARQSTTATSALDGSLSITPLALPGVPTRLVGLASTGNAASISFTVEQQP